MKKIFSNMMILAALLTAGAAMTACSNDETAINEQPVMKTYKVNINATKASDAMTRALGWDGTKLISTWTASTDKVRMYLIPDEPDELSDEPDELSYVGDLTAQSSGVSTALTGEWSVSPVPAAGKSLYLVNSNGTRTYSGQLGTFEDISANFDYAEAVTEIKDNGGSNEIVTDDAVFYNCQSIVKFTLQDKSTSSPIKATSLKVSFKGPGDNDALVTSLTYSPYAITCGELTINPTGPSGTSEIWAALSNGLSPVIPDPYIGTTPVKVILTATVGSDTYTCEQASVSFENGKYYTITANMTK